MSIQRMEIVTGSGMRRRRFSRATKEEIVAQTLDVEATVAEVARRHDLDRSLLYRWRRQLGVMAHSGDVAGFLPVTVAQDDAQPMRDDKRSDTTGSAGMIEIDVGGRHVRVGSDFDAAALARVIDVLERRAGGVPGASR